MEKKSENKLKTFLFYFGKIVNAIWNLVELILKISWEKMDEQMYLIVIDKDIIVE